MRTSFLESCQVYKHTRARSLPGATKAKLALLLHTNHCWLETTLKDPKAQLPAELALRCRRLQERFPGAPALVMSRKQAQSGSRLRPHQLLDGSQLALTKQKQQAKQRPGARYVSRKNTILRRNISSVRIFSKVSQLAKIGATRKSCKFFVVVLASVYAAKSTSLTDASKKQVQRDDSAMHVIHVVARNPS